jgi:ornithine cyclodeaminase/alanine dehydrogenase-like protein (mu-crystallin family)
MQHILGIPVKAVSTAEKAVEGVAIISAATNYVNPPMQPECLKPSIRTSILKDLEVSTPAMDRCDAVSHNLLTLLKVPVVFSMGGWSHTSEELDDFVLGLEVRQDWWHDPSYWKRLVSLENLIIESKPSRQKVSDITLFVSRGVARPFSSTGAKILQLDQVKGIGHPMPIENLLRY